MKNDAVIFVSEGDAVEVDDTRAARLGCGRGFSRSHGEKETNDYNFGDHRKRGVTESCRTGTRQLVHGAEELGRDRFLAFSWRVDVGKCN